MISYHLKSAIFARFSALPAAAFAAEMYSSYNSEPRLLCQACAMRVTSLSLDPDRKDRRLTHTIEGNSIPSSLIYCIQHTHMAKGVFQGSAQHS